MGILSLGSSVYFLMIPSINIGSESEHYYTSISIEHRGQQHSFRKDIKRFAKIFFTLDMTCYAPQLVWSGISIAFYTGVLSSILVASKPELPHQMHFEV